MKKIIAILLMVALVFSFCGCRSMIPGIKNKQAEKVDRAEISPVISEEEVNKIIEKSGIAKEKTFDTAVDTKEDSFIEESESESESSDKVFTFGETSGNVYTSEFIGIGCKLDSGWTFRSEDEIMEMNKLTLDMMGDEISSIIENSSIIYDMQATDSSQLNNININLEKVSNSQLVLLDIAKNYNVIWPTVKVGLENIGCENIEYEITTVEIDGKTMDAMYITSEINGVGVYQNIIQKKCDGYIASISLTTFFNDDISGLLDNFYWI